MFVWMHRLDQHFPVRYSAWALCLVGLVASTFAWDAIHRPRCNAARGFMFALGCIQAQTCHTGNSPTGVTTQDTRRQKALDVSNKAERVYHFHHNTLLALKELVQAAGLRDPAEITASHIVRRDSEHGVKLLANLLPFIHPGELLHGELPHPVFRTYWPLASATSFAAVPTA